MAKTKVRSSQVERKDEPINLLHAIFLAFAGSLIMMAILLFLSIKYLRFGDIGMIPSWVGLILLVVAAFLFQKCVGWKQR